MGALEGDSSWLTLPPIAESGPGLRPTKPFRLCAPHRARTPSSLRGQRTSNSHLTAYPKGRGKERTYPQSRFSASEKPNEEGYRKVWESDDWSVSHWTPEAGWFCTMARTAWMVATCQPSNIRCPGPWLHTVDWIKSGNRKIQEACVVSWHYDGILPL